MGQLSWCCAVCDHEVMHGDQPGYQKFTDAIIVWPNGDRRSGRYKDGYGRIAGVDLVDQHGGWRIVHQSCFDETKPVAELFASFKPENHATKQGWWPGERLAVKYYGQPDHSKLTKVNTYVCMRCKHTWEATWSGGLCSFGCVRPKNYRDSQEIIERGRGDHNEMVEPFRYLNYTDGDADGLIVCHNESEERTDWEKFRTMPNEEQGKRKREKNLPTNVEPCFYFDIPMQARVTKPKHWDKFMRERCGEFVIRCGGCKTDTVEILELTKLEI